MKRTILLTAMVSSLATLGVQRWLQAAPLPKRVLLDNVRARVTELTYLPGVPRERYIRPTDQIIVFLDDCKYERKDSRTGETTVRERKSGEVIWHDRAEDAPVLTNAGSKPYRTLVIELK